MAIIKTRTAPIKTIRCISEHRNGFNYSYQNQGGTLLDLGFDVSETVTSSNSSDNYWLVGEFDTTEVIGGKIKNANIVFYCENIEASGGVSWNEDSDRYYSLVYGIDDSFDLNTVTINDLYQSGAIVDPGYIDFEYKHIAERTVAYFNAFGSNNWVLSWEPNKSEYLHAVGGDEKDIIISSKLLATKKFCIEIRTIGYVVADNRRIMTRISGQGSLNPPYLELGLEDVEIQVSSLSPSNGFVSKENDKLFSWDIVFDPTDVIGAVKAKTAKFRWRMAGTSDYNEISVDGASYTVPANTFGNGNVQWQVEVTSNAGTTAISEWLTVSTIDTDAIAAPISPDGVKINREDETVFTWSHTTTYGTNATASDLQYSTNSAQWYELASVEGGELSVTVPPDTLPIGTVYWRVRTYNANGVAGAWSEAAAVTVVGKVPPPVIASVTTATAAPEIRWSAQLQQAYEARILSGSDVVYQSGTMLGTEKIHKVKALLPDGGYIAKVRVYAENGEVSDWAEYSFTISTEKPTAPTISAQPVAGGVKLLVTADATVYILRDGKPVGIARGGEYTDYGGAGKSVYVARAVASQGTYSDSRPVTAGPLLQGSVIAPADNLAAMIKLYLNLNDNPKREMTWSPVGSMSHYAGRKYPMYEYTEQEDESYNYSFAFREAKEYQAFMELVKKRGAILYRDQYGVRYYGVITGVSPGFNWGGYAVSFSVTRVDHKEGIEYDI